MSEQATIQLTRTGMRIRMSESERKRLRAAFKRQHYFRLPRFVEPGLLKVVQDQIEQAGFAARDHAGIGRTFQMEKIPADNVLCLLVNDREFFATMRQITACPQIVSFIGRVRRLYAGRGSRLEWHNDAYEGRVLAMTLNLGREPYGGGVLQLRAEGSKRIVSEVANVGPGDAIVFRIEEGFEHRNTHIEGAVSKTAFSGWFRTFPTFEEMLEKDLRKSAVAGNGQRSSGRSGTRSITKQTSIRKRPEIASRDFPQGTVLVNLELGTWYRLDPVGAQIWELLDRSRSLRAIAGRISAEYDASRDEVERDVIALCDDLAANGLIAVD